MTTDRRAIRELVLHSVQALGGTANDTSVKRWLQQNHPEVSSTEVDSELLAGSVNTLSRLKHCEHAWPRLASDRSIDLYFQPSQGLITLYDPVLHGDWEIYKSEYGQLGVRQVAWDLKCSPESVSEQVPKVDETPPTESIEEFDRTESEPGLRFIEEGQLRDHLVANLEQIEPGLKLFVDDNGVGGVEYTTPIGRIDILALDRRDRLIVIELKVSRGPDSVAGQILRYKNWVKMHLASKRQVRGLIIAHQISEQILYSIADDPELLAMEYRIHLEMRPIRKPSVAQPE